MEKAGGEPLPLEQVKEAITRGSRFLITSHPGPDGDAIGCTVASLLALKSIGKEAYAYNPDPIPEKFSFLHGVEGINDKIIGAPFDTTLLVDCSDNRMFGQAAIQRAMLGTIVVIDHHLTPCTVGDVILQDSNAASVGILLYKLFIKMGILINLPMAEAIFCSLMSDTGSFRYQNTTPESMYIAGELIDRGVDPWRVASYLYEDRSRCELDLLVHVLQTLKLSACGRAASLTVTNQMLGAFGCTPDVIDGFINYARGVRGVEVAMLLRPGPTVVRVSFRSRGRVDVSKIAERFGGGGHRNAAGCRIKGALEDVQSALFSEVDSLFVA